eukprot:scaffold24_cov341-Pavlova_lutheri.AAC.109
MAKTRARLRKWRNRRQVERFPEGGRGASENREAREGEGGSGVRRRAATEGGGEGGPERASEIRGEGGGRNSRLEGFRTRSVGFQGQVSWPFPDVSVTRAAREMPSWSVHGKERIHVHRLAVRAKGRPGRGWKIDGPHDGGLCRGNPNRSGTGTRTGRFIRNGQEHVATMGKEGLGGGRGSGAPRGGEERCTARTHRVLEPGQGKDGTRSAFTTTSFVPPTSMSLLRLFLSRSPVFLPLLPTFPSLPSLSTSPMPRRSNLLMQFPCPFLAEHLPPCLRLHQRGGVGPSLSFLLFPFLC